MYSYRIKKSAWIGRPTTTPTAVIVDDSVVVSWNGATEVVAWSLEVEDGFDENGGLYFKSVDVVLKDDFETEIELAPEFSTVYFRVVALDDHDNAIGMTGLMGKAPDESNGLSTLYSGFLALPLGAQITSFMIGCCLLLVLYWIWKTLAYCRLRRYEQYQLVPLMPRENEVS